MGAGRGSMESNEKSDHHWEDGENRRQSTTQNDAAMKADPPLSVLRRIAEDVEETLASATIVHAYRLNVKDQTFTKLDVEGPLHIVKKREAPRFLLIVLNRKTNDDLRQDVTADGFQHEQRGNYLMWRTGIVRSIPKRRTQKNKETQALWFPRQEECDKVQSVLKRITSAYTPQQRRSFGSGSPSPSPPRQGQDDPSPRQDKSGGFSNAIEGIESALQSIIPAYSGAKGDNQHASGQQQQPREQGASGGVQSDQQRKKEVDSATLALKDAFHGVVNDPRFHDLLREHVAKHQHRL